MPADTASSKRIKIDPKRNVTPTDNVNHALRMAMGLLYPQKQWINPNAVLVAPRARDARTINKTPTPVTAVFPRSPPSLLTSLTNHAPEAQSTTNQTNQSLYLHNGAPSLHQASSHPHQPSSQNPAAAHNQVGLSRGYSPHNGPTVQTCPHQLATNQDLPCQNGSGAQSGSFQPGQSQVSLLQSGSDPQNNLHRPAADQPSFSRIRTAPLHAPYLPSLNQVLSSQKNETASPNSPHLPQDPLSQDGTTVEGSRYQPSPDQGALVQNTIPAQYTSQQPTTHSGTSTLAVYYAGVPSPPTEHAMSASSSYHRSLPVYASHPATAPSDHQFGPVRMVARRHSSSATDTEHHPAPVSTPMSTNALVPCVPARSVSNQDQQSTHPHAHAPVTAPRYIHPAFAPANLIACLNFLQCEYLRNGMAINQYDKNQLHLMGMAAETGDAVFITILSLTRYDEYDPSGLPDFFPRLQSDHLRLIGSIMGPSGQMTSGIHQRITSIPFSLGHYPRHLGLPLAQALANEVAVCISKLSNSWDVMMQTCSMTKILPLPQDLLRISRIKSPIFQRCVFFALMRRIWEPWNPTSPHVKYVLDLFNLTVDDTFRSGECRTPVSAFAYYKSIFDAYVSFVGLDCARTEQLWNFSRQVMVQSGLYSFSDQQGLTSSLLTPTKSSSEQHFLEPPQAKNSPSSSKQPATATRTPPSPPSEAAYASKLCLAAPSLLPKTSPTPPVSRSATEPTTEPTPVRTATTSPAVGAPPSLPFRTGRAPPVSRSTPESISRSALQDPAVASEPRVTASSLPRASPTPPACRSATEPITEPPSVGAADKDMALSPSDQLASSMLCHVRRLIFGPHTINPPNSYVQTFEFTLTQADLDELLIYRNERYLDPLKDITRYLRLRCCRFSGMPSDAEFCLCDTFWPCNIYFSLNDANIFTSFVANKNAVEITTKVILGRNKLVISVNRPSTDLTPLDISFAIEVVEVAKATSILEERQQSIVPASKIYAKLKALCAESQHSANQNGQVPGTALIELRDPLSYSRIFEIPVRGRDCTHLQPFDLVTFLLSRPKVSWTEHITVEAEEWRCPICRGDARPVTLTIDGFLLEVRSQLDRSGMLGARYFEFNGNSSQAEAIELGKFSVDNPLPTTRKLVSSFTSGYD